MAVPCSEEAFAAWLWETVGAAPVALRTVRFRLRRGRADRVTIWHVAVFTGRLDVCEYLKCRGLLDMIDEPDHDGRTPLHDATASEFSNQEEAVRWLVEHAADINAITNDGFTVFSLACSFMSFSFVAELAGKVAPDHLALPDEYDQSPISVAFKYNDAHHLPIVRFLILRGGAPARSQDFPASTTTTHEIDLHDRRRSDVVSGERLRLYLTITDADRIAPDEYLVDRLLERRGTARNREYRVNTLRKGPQGNPTQFQVVSRHVASPSSEEGGARSRASLPLAHRRHGGRVFRGTPRRKVRALAALEPALARAEPFRGHGDH